MEQKAVLHLGASGASRLFVNGVKVASSDRYNRPRPDQHRVQVTLRAGDDASRGVLAVRDSGLGISASKMDALFQPFNRLGREQGSTEGTGIGLAMVAHIVAARKARVFIGNPPLFAAEAEALADKARLAVRNCPEYALRLERIATKGGTS